MLEMVKNMADVQGQTSTVQKRHLTLLISQILRRTIVNSLRFQLLLLVRKQFEFFYINFHINLITSCWTNTQNLDVFVVISLADDRESLNLQSFLINQTQVVFFPFI